MKRNCETCKYRCVEEYPGTAQEICIIHEREVIYCDYCEQYEYEEVKQ